MMTTPYWLVLGYGVAIVAVMAIWVWAGRDPQRAEPNVLDMTDEERDERLEAIVRRIDGR